MPLSVSPSLRAFLPFLYDLSSLDSVWLKMPVSLYIDLITCFLFIAYAFLPSLLLVPSSICSYIAVLFIIANAFHVWPSSLASFSLVIPFVYVRTSLDSMYVDAFHYMYLIGCIFFYTLMPICTCSVVAGFYIITESFQDKNINYIPFLMYNHLMYYSWRLARMS